jgi:hypothetical protein
MESGKHPYRVKHPKPDNKGGGFFFFFFEFSGGNLTAIKIWQFLPKWVG